jgi:hypothetical protein
MKRYRIRTAERRHQSTVSDAPPRPLRSHGVPLPYRYLGLALLHLHPLDLRRQRVVDLPALRPQLRAIFHADRRADHERHGAQGCLLLLGRSGRELDARALQEREVGFVTAGT